MEFTSKFLASECSYATSSRVLLFSQTEKHFISTHSFYFSFIQAS